MAVTLSALGPWWAALLIDASFLLLFNAHSDPVTFTLPASNWAGAWTRVIATDDARGEGGGTRLNAGEAHEVGARSVVVLQAEG